MGGLPAGRALELLLIEDSEDDALLLEREFKLAGRRPHIERVESADALSAALDRQPWDIIVADYNLPRFSGADALAMVRGRKIDTPFIFVSGSIGEETAVAAMRAGASDYVMKGSLARLLPAIDRELREAEGRRARQRAEAALRASEASHAALVDHAPVGIFRATVDGRFLTINRALVAMLGYERTEDVLALDLSRDVYVDPDDRLRLMVDVQQSGQEHADLEGRWKRRDGRLLTVQLTVHAVRDDDRRVTEFETIVRDITAQRELEAQLVVAQKMEAIGRLAGGVAHDFNNLLTVIASSSDLILADLPPDHPQREDATQIRQAADAAASLTRQLLAFSRQQVLQPVPLDLNGVVTGTEKMLRRLIGEDVRLTTALDPGLGWVKADPGQVEQVIMNLAVNARDAMPTGGQLTIETANMEMDEAYVRGHPLAHPGPYVMLAVTDTGMGMDQATQGHIFEPFFTTKEPGKGTGLGLATVYGIVKQSGGFIWVYSEPGQGATFKVYLPQVADPGVRAPHPAPPAVVLRGTETILIVEDVAAVRAVTRQVLERQGYTVLEAPDGTTALAIGAKHKGKIDLLLTDVVMPNIGGRQVAERLREVRPETKVLYMSGYTDDAIVHHGVLNAGISYLQKPFTPDVLARKVREVLDGGEGRP